MTEDEMVGCHCQLNGHEFEHALGYGEGQGGLVCCSLWGCKELDITQDLATEQQQCINKYSATLETRRYLGPDEDRQRRKKL